MSDHQPNLNYLPADLLGTLDEGALVVELDGKITYANQSWVDITGYPIDEIVGSTPPYPWWPTNLLQREQRKQLVLDLLAFNKPFEFEQSVLRFNNDQILVTGTGTPITNEDGVHTKWVIISKETTDRDFRSSELQQHAQDLEALNAELARANAFNASLIEYAPDATLVVDENGKILVANDQAERLFGYTRSQLTSFAIETLVPERIRDAHPKLRTKYKQHATLRPMGKGLALTAVRADGSEIPVDILLSPFEAEGRQLVLAVARDVTDRRLLEEARKEADRANQAKSEFLSRMSHELRTPLGAILGFTSIMDEESDELLPRHKDMVKRMDRAGHHLMSLINDVLDISRIESGHLSLSIEPVKLAEVVERARELVDILISGNNLTVEIDIDHDMWVMADRSRLQQVTVNLLSNAAKYNRSSGYIKVNSTISEFSTLIEIKDSGVGIDHSKIDDMFRPFARLGAEQTRVEGTGLGLALSKALIEQMYGRLYLQETSPAGTTFVISLPSSTPQIDMTQLDSKHDLQAEMLQHTESCILYIEDNDDNVAVLRQSLRRFSGIAVHSAPDGTKGLTAARELEPDVIFLDLHLPDQNGRDVLRQLKNDHLTEHIPVVIITADALGSTSAELLGLGASLYLTKPISQARVIDAMSSFVVAAHKV